MVKTDFKLRYQGSFLGYAWSLLRPLALFIILYVVFTKFLRIGDSVPNYAVYLLLGIVVWSYFVEVTNGSVGAIVGKGDLIRKINFPKYVIVLSSSFSALINLGINLLVVFAFIIYQNISIDFTVLWMPLLIAELFIFSLSIAFFLSAAFVKFRDVSYIWDVVAQGLFYATPILYPLSIVPENIQKLIILNPLAQIVQDFRFISVTKVEPTISTIYGTPWARLIPITITILMAVIASWYFRKRSKFFAEEV
jgi:ABC-2 type transport system permease protein